MSSTQTKQKSGAQKRKERAQRDREMQSAKPLPLGAASLPPPPADDLDLQTWGARCAAVLAHLVITNPSAMLPEQWRYAREYLATLGLLFPRSALIKRAQKELKRREGKEEEEELKPLEGIDPGPASRFGRGAAGRGKPVP